MQRVIELRSWTLAHDLLYTRPAAYSLSVNRDEMNISHSGKREFTASSQAPIPASPVLNLLTATNKANDSRPILASIHV